ncbi:MAG: hypothetical protein IPO40_10625 [Fibrobacteres bacterium]|nr:hypothetical protein [Fibrobacterota bacterium]
MMYTNDFKIYYKWANLPEACEPIEKQLFYDLEGDIKVVVGVNTAFSESSVPLFEFASQLNFVMRNVSETIDLEGHQENPIMIFSRNNVNLALKIRETNYTLDWPQFFEEASRFIEKISKDLILMGFSKSDLTSHLNATND